MRSFEEVLPGLQKSLKMLESLRQETRATAMKGWLGIGLALPIGGGATLAAYQFLPTLVGHLMVAFALGGVGYLYYQWVDAPYQRFRASFKTHFIRPIVSACGDDIVYEPTGYLHLEEYMASLLYPRDVDRHKGEDLLHGRVGATEVRMSELHTEYKTTSTDSKGRTRTSWHTIFKGLFVSADFHKHFNGQTFVRSDIAEKGLGSLGRFFQKPVFGGSELIQLEDPDFEREFKVTSTDQVEARYILSTSMMRRMLDLKAKFAAPVEFSFIDSRMYIAISVQRNLFEPTFGQPLIDKDYIYHYYDQVATCVAMVEDLGLNVRVWGKG
jgi:hypothetical protein